MSAADYMRLKKERFRQLQVLNANGRLSTQDLFNEFLELEEQLARIIPDIRKSIVLLG